MRSTRRPTRHRGRTVVAAVALGLFSAAGLATAADHQDSPRPTSEPPADINDVYAWTTPDAERLNLVMTVFPNATENSQFSDAVRYVFHVNSSESPGAQATETQVVCTFNAQQQVSCDVGGNQLISNQDASDQDGVTSSDERFRVFTGLRSDPFFFALDAFRNTVDQVVQAAPQLEFNEAGCPKLDQSTQSALVNSLKGTNSFAGMNVLAIVVQADKSLFGPGPIYGVWASTNRAGA